MENGRGGHAVAFENLGVGQRQDVAAVEAVSGPQGAEIIGKAESHGKESEGRGRGLRRPRPEAYRIRRDLTTPTTNHDHRAQQFGRLVSPPCRQKSTASVARETG